MTIEELKKYKNQFIKYLSNNKRSYYTINSYSYHLEKMLKCIEDKYGVEIDIKVAILDYVDNISGSYKPTTINTMRSPIRGFLTYLKTRGYILEDFGGNIELLHEDSKTKEILEPNEIQDIFNVLASELRDSTGYNIYYKSRNLMLFTLLLYTGVRRNEAVKLKWSNIDFINNTINIFGKGNKTRVIPLISDLKQQLYSYRDTLEKMNEIGYNVKSDYIFRSEWRNKETKKKDRPMTGKNVEVIIKETCDKAGIDKSITPHSIRHTFASYGVKNNINLTTLSNILGHSNLSTTLNIYAHEISMEEKKREMEKIKYIL